MFNNVALDIFIGLIFIYLLYSLLATIVQEIIARRLSLRTRNLLRGLRRMLEDRPHSHKKTILADRLSSYFTNISESISYLFKPFPKDSFTKAFYNSPSIKYLGENQWRSKPSYIHPENFSRTIIQLLRGKEYNGSIAQMHLIESVLFKKKSIQPVENEITKIDEETLIQLQQLYLDANKDIDRFRNLLENWFNETMDRVAGWYKRQAQLILFLIGFSLAAIFNVDTIAIYRMLSKDKEARDQMVQLAIHSIPQYDSLSKVLKRNNGQIISYDTLKGRGGKDSIVKTIRDTVFVALSDSSLNSAYRQVYSDIENANSTLGIGWPDKDSCRVCELLKAKLIGYRGDNAGKAKLSEDIKLYMSKFNCDGNQYQTSKKQIFFGWMLTALAISLGAPFWFDMLNKIVQLRSTGPKPGTKSSNVKSKSGGNDVFGKSPIDRVG